MTTETIQGLKVVKWYNRKTKEITYGIDVQVGRQWHHLCEGKDPLIFKNSREASAKIKQICKEEGVL
jgi:hypothetical protein